jgi:pilus assembly protein CpaB
MNQTKRLLVLGVALACAGLAALIASNMLGTPPKAIKEVKEVAIDQVDILVATRDIGLGDRITAADIKWAPWPKTAVANYITKAKLPNGLAEYDRAIARVPLTANEPISPAKFVRCFEDASKRRICEGGALSAILPAGMRAISVKIAEDTSAGRFILPNDMVDVILTRRLQTKSGGSAEFISDTLFQNVRVLAIGQTIETKDPGRDNKKTVDGNTATLELTPQQAEQLALAKSMGEISLSLRSLADIRENQGPVGLKISNQRGNAIKLLRYGVATRAYGVN